jgi:hypothetical protein
METGNHAVFGVPARAKSEERRKMQSSMRPVVVVGCGQLLAIAFGQWTTNN